MTGKEEQLSDNVMMIDQRYPRSPSAPQRRLVLAVDHTYLQRMLCQAKVADEPGLVGGPWCPASEQDAFLPFKSMAEGCLNRPRARSAQKGMPVLSKHAHDIKTGKTG